MIAIIVRGHRWAVISPRCGFAPARVIDAGAELIGLELATTGVDIQVPFELWPSSKERLPFADCPDHKAAVDAAIEATREETWMYEVEYPFGDHRLQSGGKPIGTSARCETLHGARRQCRFYSGARIVAVNWLGERRVVEQQCAGLPK